MLSSAHVTTKPDTGHTAKPHVSPSECVYEIKLTVSPTTSTTLPSLNPAKTFPFDGFMSSDLENPPTSYFAV